MNKLFRNKVECKEMPKLGETRNQNGPLYAISRRNDEAVFFAKRTLKFIMFFSLLLFFSSCHFNTVLDTNQSIEDNQWLYANAAKADFEITDAAKPYQVNFKLRINTDYRYSNLFVLATFKDAKGRKRTRYQFKLAKEDGQWLGKGSGDLYTYVFPLLKDHRFADTGKYSIEIEQNMRDNPLVGISDVGIEVK